MTIKRSKQPKLNLPVKLVIGSLFLATILLLAIIITVPDKYLHVSFLDVGQGDAVLIQTPDGKNILIDGGPSPQKLHLELSKKLPFWERTIDLVISTQPQADHIAGLVDILRRYEVKQVIQADTGYNSAIYQEWLDVINNDNIKHRKVNAGQIIDLGNDISIEVLNPPAKLFEGTSSDTDNNGLVLRLEWGQISFLFTADIRRETEFNMIMRRANLESTILKVAHHGSNTSTSGRLLSLINPEIAVISVGSDNSYGHPHAEVIDTLASYIDDDRIYRTDISGTVEFITDGNRLWIKTEK